MRTLIDANVFISYLLPTKDSQKSTTIQRIVDAGFARKYTIVFPQELVSEIKKKSKKSPTLQSISRVRMLKNFLNCSKLLRNS